MREEGRDLGSDLDVAKLFKHGSLLLHHLQRVDHRRRLHT